MTEAVILCQFCCPRYTENEVTQSWNCIFLNVVWVPRSSAAFALCIIIWSHLQAENIILAKRKDFCYMLFGRLLWLWTGAKIRTFFMTLCFCINEGFFEYDLLFAHLGMDPISVSLEESTGKETVICESKVCSHRWVRPERNRSWKSLQWHSGHDWMDTQRQKSLKKEREGGNQWMTLWTRRRQIKRWFGMSSMSGRKH